MVPRTPPTGVAPGPWKNWEDTALGSQSHSGKLEFWPGSESSRDVEKHAFPRIAEGDPLNDKKHSLLVWDWAWGTGGQNKQ